MRIPSPEPEAPGQSPMRYVAPPAHASPGEVHDAGPADEDTPTAPSHPNCPSRVRATATPSGAGPLPQPRRLPENTADRRQPACSTKHAAPRTGISRVRNSLRAGTPQAATLRNHPPRARRPDRRLFSRPASGRRTVEISTDRPLRRRPGDRQIISPAVAHTSLYWPTCND